MFPGAGAVVYYNEAGEPLGWDYPSYDEPDYDPYDDVFVNGDEDEEDEGDEPIDLVDSGQYEESFGL